MKRVLLSLFLSSAAMAQDIPRPPVGEPAPPTQAARTQHAREVRAGVQVFAQYSYRDTRSPEGTRTWFHTFDVPRVHAALHGEYDRASGRVVLEGTRAGGEGSLVGVGGDSVVLRVREAYGAYQPLDWLRVQAGVVPTFAIAALDGTWMMRPVQPSTIEALRLASPADLGLTAHVSLPRRYGRVELGAFNGEGYTSRELNRGKNGEIAAEVHPLASIPVLQPLAIFVSYGTGSSGTQLARADRLNAALLWQGDRIRGGIAFTYAWGVPPAGAQRSTMFDAFVRAEPIARVLVGARVAHVTRDTRAETADKLTTITGTAGYVIAAPFEVFLAVTRSIPTTRAEGALPGADHWDARLVAHVLF